GDVSCGGGGGGDGCRRSPEPNREERPEFFSFACIAGQVNELVALIPYSDQRLQPQRTKLYVFISIFLCLLISGLAGFFLFPRSLVVNDDGIKVVMINFDTNNSRVFIDMTVMRFTLNISNSNFYSVSVDTLTCQVEYMKTVNYTVRIEFSGPLAYV
uniref:Transmembrane protein 106C n=1 Tax=Callorhinchus milii TaxID=7868 RepID=A0A4W3IKT4_CALMI